MNVVVQPLVIKDLTKRYRHGRGVEHINLELVRGEIFGFLGPNGAGKSTTIRTIMDFIRPTEGSVSVFGLDGVKDSVAIKARVGYLAGDIALYENMTARQLLEYLSNLRKTTDWEYVNSLIKRFGAEMDRPIYSLSKGNKQKIGLIQAFMHGPELIILDEPTSGLDPLVKQVFYEVVREAKQKGTTVFLSSHDLAEVQKICDRAGFIREGKLIAIEDVSHAGRMHFRRYRVTFNEIMPQAGEFRNLPSVTDVQVYGNSLTITVNGPVAEFITELAKHQPTSLEEQEVSLEDVFMHYYQAEPGVPHA